jgi:glycosyltransferase involved in cell wall biosynthesis
MACGCPSVTTNVGAVPEFAKDRVTSLVVKPGDIDGMAHAMDELLENRGLHDRLAANGLDAARHWSLARVAPLFERALVSAADYKAVNRATNF